MNSKRIIVSTHDPIHPIRGGGALRTLKVAAEFEKRGYQITLIAPTDGRTYVNGLKVLWLSPPRKQRSQILSCIKFNIRLLRRFLPLLGKTDMVFIHNTIAAILIPFLKKIFNFRFVLDITDIHAEYLPIGKRNILERLITPLLLRYEYWIIKSADTIIVVTSTMAQLLRRKGISSQKIHVVYDGVDLEELSDEKEKDAATQVIHLGTIDRQHGVELLVEAIPKVLQRFPSIKFYFVGGGRELPKIKRMVEKLLIKDNCIFTDYLPCKEARNYLKKAVIGVIPRKDYLPNRIITTLKIYEYWASGTAVIATRLPGIEEIAKDGEDVLFFQSGNAQDLAEKIIRLIEDKKLRDRLIKKGQEKALLFQWKKLIPQIVEFSLNSL